MASKYDELIVESMTMHLWALWVKRGLSCSYTMADAPMVPSFFVEAFPLDIRLGTSLPSHSTDRIPMPPGCFS